MSDETWLRTGIGASDADSITLMGRDLASELMGKVTFTELTFLLVRKRMPSAEEARLLDAVLVSLADHGLTPTVLAARLTHTGAPESIQGAIAAGLLGAGSVFLGVVEDTARFLDEILAAGGDAAEAVGARIAAGQRIPGLGHPVHKVGDPRTPRIYAIAEETGQLGPHLELLQGRGRGPPRADRPRPADQRRRRGGRGARRPRLPAAAAARRRAARTDRGPARPPRGGDGAPDRDAALPRGRRAGGLRPAPARRLKPGPANRREASRPVPILWPPPPGEEPFSVQEMVIYGVSFDMVGKQPIVLLKTVDSNKFLPIWIGHPEAAAILMKLQGATTPRPMTHDLVTDMLTELDVTCTRVQVTELKENTFYASITLTHNGQEVEIDSRPSDALALAVRAGAPIFAAEDVISESAIEFEHEVEDTEQVVEKFKDFLDNVTPEDFAGGEE